MRRVLKAAGWLLAVVFMFLNFSAPVQELRALPQEINLFLGQRQELTMRLPLQMSLKQEQAAAVVDFVGQRLSDVEGIHTDVALTPEQCGQATLEVSFLGLTLKTIELNVLPERTLVPGGHSIGVALFTKGALVVGSADIPDDQGVMRNPAREAGIQPGDIILKAGGVEVRDADHLTELISACQGDIRMDLTRNGAPFSVTLRPVSATDGSGQKRLGLWVRDSTAGVGTLTYYDPQNETYAALGHGIADPDTGTYLTVKNGEILQSKIIDVRQGVVGEPGELHGSFLENQKTMGDIRQNCEFGIYGQAYAPIENSLYSTLPVGSRSMVREGHAQILTTVDDQGIRLFDCRILSCAPQSHQASKGMVIQITDPQLLDKTGGIVQGMSGSPIIQDGRIIGVVTHVFINDPTRGYAMNIEWMLTESDK